MSVTEITLMKRTWSGQEKTSAPAKEATAP